MLKEIHIQNLAIIEQASIEFEQGFNVFTGETGAGKTIIIGAINAILGHRTSKDIVRHNTSKATITAVFTNVSSSVSALLDYDFTDEDLIISREISAQGKSTAKIMGKPVPLTTLKEVGELLIDIHGQHDNNQLLSTKNHLAMLDNYGDYQSIIEKYIEAYRQVVNIKRELAQAHSKVNVSSQQLELLNHQATEIAEANLTIGEDDTLQEKKKELDNKQRIITALSNAYTLLNGFEDNTISSICQVAYNSVADVSEFIDNGDKLATRLEDISIELSDISSELENALDTLTNQPIDIDTVNQRLDLIYNLKAKYGSSISDIIEFGKNAEKEIKDISISDERIVELNELGQSAYTKLMVVAEELTKQRKKSADKFCKSVCSHLTYLDMPNVQIGCDFNHVKPNSKGQDEVEFLISTNKGEPLKPISKIASGGELSRIMLSIKNTMAQKDKMPTMIFDEIDTGVSGSAAQKIGLKLLEVSDNRQIICVTHLAQISALADHHFLIKKDSNNNTTSTSIFKLNYEQRVQEVARIMGTGDTSPLMLSTAESMIKRKNE